MISIAFVINSDRPQVAQHDRYTQVSSIDPTHTSLHSLSHSPHSPISPKIGSSSLSSLPFLIQTPVFLAVRRVGPIALASPRLVVEPVCVLSAERSGVETGRRGICGRGAGVMGVERAREMGM